MHARPKVLILHASGSNRDREAARACELAGGDPQIVLVDAVLSGAESLDDFQMLLLPGGFSYGDDLGAGKLWALRLRSRLGDQLAAFVDAGKPVLGICNGFQALVKSGLLPGPLAGLPAPVDASRPATTAGAKRSTPKSGKQRKAGKQSKAGKARAEAAARQARVFGPAHATLTRNRSARFECRWVYLAATPGSPCVFTQALGSQLIHCPVAHGEGRFVARDAATLAALEQGGQAALRYVTATGATLPAAASYPANPNGSDHHIAGVCNAAGNVLGLMPHPEDHVVDRQHPGYHAGLRGQLGLALFEAGVQYAAQR